MRSDHKIRKTLFALPALLASSPLWAQATDAPTHIDSGDTAWMLTATAFVLLMTIPGLALFYGGMVRAKNLLSVLMQCFAITALVTVLWMVYGYSLAFSTAGMQLHVTNLHSFIGGLDRGFLAGLKPDSRYQTVPESVFIMFQLTFAIITPALIIGAFAERMKFSALLWFSGLWLTIVYLPVAHMVWSGPGSFLGDLGVIDFAGGTVVHINAGIAGLVACLVIGKRRGYPNVPMPPHNLGYTVMGASLLWLGWFGFNAGSAVAANGSAGMAMTVTHIAAATASLTWMFVDWSKQGKPTLVGIVTGAIAGLATITPASGFVGPVGAIVIGFAAGIICSCAVHVIREKFKVDDSLDVLAVHGVGGALGIILVAILAAEGLGGVGLAKGMTIGKALGVQILGVLATVVWTVVLTFIILKIVGALVGLRVDEEHEAEGLDLATHGEKGYEL